ncbi:unnamed protein product, partial [Symbiodinium sp. CCMP2592]
EPVSDASGAVHLLRRPWVVFIVLGILGRHAGGQPGLGTWSVASLLLYISPVTAVQIHSGPASPRDAVISAARAPDRQIAAPAGAHSHLQSKWLLTGDFGDGPLWLSLPSPDSVFLITCRLWLPGSVVRFEFSSTDRARDVSAELYRQAIRLGRSQIVAASVGPTLEVVHLVSLPSHPGALTVLFDLGREIVCSELPFDYSPSQVMTAAQEAASTSDIQILKGPAHRLRHGDVIRVIVNSEQRTLDVSAFTLPPHVASASRWLQESRVVSFLHSVEGVISFEVPRSCALDITVLSTLLQSVIPGRHVFVEIPGADALPHAAFGVARPGQDCVTYRLTDASDPSAAGLLLAFAGVFESFSAFLDSLLYSNRPAAVLLRRLQPFGLSVLSWECTVIPGRGDCHYWHVHVQADLARAREYLLHLHWARSICVFMRVTSTCILAHILVLDILVTPPSPPIWWILRDSIGCELLRPVVQHFTSHCSFFFCAIEPDGVVHSVEPSAEVRHMSPSPQGARALIGRALPGLVGRLVDGVLHVVAARACSPAIFGGLTLILLGGQSAAMHPPYSAALATVDEVPPPAPTTMRIWTLNVPVPVDLPWRPQGYPTRWLRELMCRLHHIDDPGEFRSTLSSPGGTVQHVLFVPIVPTTHPTARFWLLHWGDAAVVTFGHTPFHWDVVSAHIRALFPGGPLPDRCPALSFAGQFYPPGAPLPDFPSGAVIQIIIGALARIPGDDDPWNPDPLVVDSPFFRHVPSRGPALEPAIRLDGSGNQLAAGALQTPLVDQGVQTDLSGNGTGLDHATVSRVHLLSRELSFHTSRLWAGLAEPDAEPVGDSPSVLRLSSQSACAAASAPNVDLLDIGGTSGSHKLALPSSVSWVLVGALLGFRGVASGSFLALATVSDGSIIFPPPDCSDEEQSDEEGPPPVQAENMSVASGAPVPFTIPAGPPPPEPVNAPFQPRLRYLRAARPLEDYALGLWPSTLDREPAADEDVVRRVQADLLGLQRGLRTFAAAIPLGTPFCIHNPFTARQQCDIVEYSAGPELNPFVLFQGHARSRGWAGMVLLMPQPDATAVHLIGCPQAPGNVAVGVVIDGRLLPCCLPACVACAALQALHLDGQEYDLRPPDVHEETAVVQFRNGDCLAAGRRPSRQLPSHQDVQAATAETLGGGTDDAATVPGSTSAAFRAAGLWVWLVVTSARSHGVAPAMLALCLWRAEVLGMHRPGGFPWGIDPVNRRFSGITSEDPVEVVLHSPFLGVFPPFTASQDTCHTQAWAQFRTADPGWAADYFPVWPGPAFNELSVVPVGHDPALVTIMLVWGGHHRATLTPRTMTVAWLTSFVARHINSEVGGLSLPHGLAVCEYFDIPPAAFRFRNGDVVYIHDPPADPDEPLEFVEPWHLQDGLAAHHAPWAVGFQLMFPISVHLLRPEKPPLLTSIPAGESWCPEAFSFSGDFRHQFPGFWTPVQWTSARALQLMAVNEVAAKVNVVAATPEGRLCRSVDRVVSRDSLAAQLRFCPATVQVGGVPSYAMEQACELRNGDVIFGEFARGACATASCRLGWWLGTAFAFSQLPMARQFLLVLAVGLMHGGQSSSLGAGALFFLPSAAAMIQRAPAAPLATPAIPAATVNRVTLTLANPFAPWQRVEVDPSNAFEDVIADAHHTLTSWHRGFAESGLVSDGSHVLVPRPGDLIAVWLFQSDPSAGPRETPVFLTWGAAHAASAWHSDFIVAHASCVLLWSPSRPTRVALLRHQARWNAAEATVCQHEEALGVHRWAPCHGVSRLTEALHMTFTFKGFPSAPPPVRLLRKPVYATAIGGFIPLQLDCLVVGYLRWPDFCSLCMVSVGQPGLCPPAPRADVPVLTLQKLAPFAPGCRLGGVAPVIGTALTAIFLRESISAVVNLMSCRRGGSLIVLTVSFVLPAAFQVQGPWSLFEAVGSRHCGAWATRFFPVRAAFPFAQVTLAPVAPFGMASVVFHTLSGTAVALASVDASLEDIQRLAARLIPSTRFWVVIPPPSIRAAHMYTHIRLRNGDAFGFLPDSTQPGSTRFPALHYPSLDRARQVASWSLSFRFDTGGPVTLWTTSSRFGQLVYVRDNAYWDPLGPTFRSLGGETLTGSWVPVLTGDLSDLHLMSRTSISEAHVLFLLPPEQTPVGVFLAGCNTHRIPLGWQLLPAIRYVRAGSTLRDGDVLVIARMLILFGTPSAHSLPV